MSTVKKSVIVDRAQSVQLSSLIIELNNLAASQETECDWNTLTVHVETMTDGILSGSTVMTGEVGITPTT